MRFYIPDCCWQTGLETLVFKKKFSYKKSVKQEKKTEQKDFSLSAEIKPLSLRIWTKV